MMKDFFGNLIFALIIMAVIVGVIAVDRWFGSFWSLLLTLVLFVAFIFGTTVAIGKAMNVINKYRTEVEMEEEKEIADTFNKCNKEYETDNSNNE